jgi:hypothetical protein
MRSALILTLAVLAVPAGAAELKFDFSQFPADQAPTGFRSTVAGQGQPGDWKIVLDAVPPLLAPLTDQAPVVTKRAVLAQLAQDPTDEHFPILVYEGETFTDFTLTTRFKTVKGEKEQMAGVVFRLQDERNFYVVRASSLGNTFRFYKVVDGQRAAPIGPQIEIPKGVWHELTVECKGNQIRCLLNGKEALPALGDTSFPKGKIGFWTKSDSVSYFADTRVTYTASEPLAHKLVRDALVQYPRVRDLKIFAPKGGEKTLQVVGAKQKADLGKAGGATEKKVLDEGQPRLVRGKGVVTVVMPLRDRNGDTIAAARVTMESFTGQTEGNVLVRALPIVKGMQARITTLEELVE